MASLTDSSIDGLLARRTVNGRIIRVPDFPNLNKSQRAQVLAVLQQEGREGIGPGFDQGPLEATLSSLTPPPPSKEQLFIEAQRYEIKARQDLEAEGCPPCYPPNLKIPLQNIPEKYQKIISYWQLSSSEENVELLAQFRHWERFRKFQKKIRHDYGTRERPFSQYVEGVRKLRQCHGLEGDVPLRFGLEEKDRKLENWIEFQAFHILSCIKPLEKTISGQKTAMDSLQKKANSADAAVSKIAADNINFNQPAWKHQEQKLEMERYFLQWTEQKRMAMDPGYPTPVEVDRDAKAVRIAFVSDRRKRQPKARSVPCEPGISKRKQDMRRQKPTIPNTAPSPLAMDSSPPTSNVSRIPDSPATKPRRIKTQTPRRQPPPQKVSKAKRFDNANAKSVVASRRRAIGQKRFLYTQSSRRSQPTLVEVMTRSGRMSRPPVKWAPA